MTVTSGVVVGGVTNGDTRSGNGGCASMGGSGIRADPSRILPSGVPLRICQLVGCPWIPNMMSSVIRSGVGVAAIFPICYIISQDESDSYGFVGI